MTKTTNLFVVIFTLIFFLIDNNFQDEKIKIEQMRSLLKFLSKTSYSKNLKIVMLDNSENLNINAANTLLKVLEEPSENTFFFLIHDNASPILDTIKSTSFFQKWIKIIKYFFITFLSPIYKRIIFNKIYFSIIFYHSHVSILVIITITCYTPKALAN